MNIAYVILLALVALSAGEEQTTQEFLLSLPTAECENILKMVKDEHNGIMPDGLRNLKCKAPINPLAGLLQQSGSNMGTLNLPSDMEQDYMDTLLKFSEGFQTMAEEKKKSYRPQKVVVPGQRCYRQSDCPLNYLCAEIEGGFMDVLERNNDLDNFHLIKDAFDLDGRECTRDWGSFLRNNLTSLMPAIYRAYYQIESAVNKTVGQRGFEKFVKKLNFVFLDNFDDVIGGPVTRQLGVSNAMNQETILLLSLMGRGNSDDSLASLLVLSMLGPEGGLGGSGIMNNPILLSLLLNPAGIGGGDDLLKIIILSQSMGTGQGFGGVGPTQGFSLPLIFLLMQDQNSSSDPLSLFLPLLLSGGNQLDPMGILLISGLLSGNGSSGLDALMPLLLLGGGAGMGGMDPMVLLLISGGAGGSGLGNLTSDPLLLYFLLGGLGSGGNTFDPFTMLLILGGQNGTESADLMKILFLSDPRFANNPLAIFTLFGDGLFGNSSSGGFADNPLLLYLLFMTDGNSGLTGPVNGPYIANPIPVSGVNTAIPPPGAAIPGPTFGGPSSFFGRSQTGFGDGIFDLILITMLSDNGNTDFLNIFLLMFMLNPERQATQPDYYGAPVDPFQPQGFPVNNPPIFDPLNQPQGFPVNNAPIYDPLNQPLPANVYIPPPGPAFN